MKAKVSKKSRNIGSKPTPAQSQGASSNSLKTSGRPSFEGYQSGSRADINLRGSGYMDIRNQKARFSSKSLPSMPNVDGPGIINGVSEKFSRMYSIGNKNTGSAGILSARRELNSL